MCIPLCRHPPHADIHLPASRASVESIKTTADRHPCPRPTIATMHSLRVTYCSACIVTRARGPHRVRHDVRHVHYVPHAQCAHHHNSNCVARCCTDAQFLKMCEQMRQRLANVAHGRQWTVTVISWWTGIPVQILPKTTNKWRRTVPHGSEHQNSTLCIPRPR